MISIKSHRKPPLKGNTSYYRMTRFKSINLPIITNCHIIYFVAQFIQRYDIYFIFHRVAINVCFGTISPIARCPSIEKENKRLKLTISSLPISLAIAVFRTNISSAVLLVIFKMLVEALHVTSLRIFPSSIWSDSIKIRLLHLLSIIFHFSNNHVFKKVIMLLHPYFIVISPY